MFHEIEDVSISKLDSAALVIFFASDLGRLRMFELHFIFPGDPETLTGGYIYDNRIVDGLWDRGWKVCRHILPDGFPFPHASSLDKASEVLGRIPDDRLVIIDGLALAPMVELIERHSARLVLIGLIHHPLAEETGITAAQKSLLWVQERRVLAMCARVVVTSSTTAAALASNYGVGPDRLVVIEPGVDAAPLAVGPRKAVINLLSVATVTPRKGHDLLIAALAPLRKQSWRLSCVGDLERDPVTTAHVRKCVARFGLESRIKFRGVLGQSALARQYHSADLFVLASQHEGYGMALAEALACGVPIVATRVGAIPVTVPTNAGLLVPPGSSRDLTSALMRFFDEPRLRMRLKAGARASRLRGRSWDVAARCLEKQLRELMVG